MSDDKRTLPVDGFAKVSHQPELAVMTLSVIERGDNPVTLREAGDVKMSQVMTVVRELINPVDGDLRTVNYSLNLERQWNDLKRVNEVVGYVFQHTLAVKVRDFDKLPKLMARVPNLGLNDFQGPNWQLTDTTVKALRVKARQLAVLDAVEKAKQLVDALNVARLAVEKHVAIVKLGEVLSISGSSRSYSPVVNRRMAMAAACAPEQDDVTPEFEAGDLDVTADVSVAFELTQ